MLSMLANLNAISLSSCLYVLHQSLTDALTGDDLLFSLVVL
jgi:hypothetical protein